MSYVIKGEYFCQRIGKEVLVIMEDGRFKFYCLQYDHERLLNPCMLNRNIGLEPTKCSVESKVREEDKIAEGIKA